MTALSAGCTSPGRRADCCGWTSGRRGSNGWEDGAFAIAEEGLPPEWTMQLRRYFGGEPVRFTIPLDLRGTAFEREVWAALQKIPYGQTRTYAQIAAQIERPDAARAVGRANGKNPVSVVVPCHRVVAAHGPGGYGAGIETKRALLDLEARGAAEGCVV